MHTTTPPQLETFNHWPSWLNARGHLDRSACFELKVSDLRRVAGCIPMGLTKKGKPKRLRGRAQFNVPDLPNEQRAINGKGRLTTGWYDLCAWEMNELARGHMPRKLSGDWRTGRAPAMRPALSNTPAMALTQGGYGPGMRVYEKNRACAAKAALLELDRASIARPVLSWERGRSHNAPGVLDAGLEGNPNRGASREKRFGLDDDWAQRVGLEKWSHSSVSGVQYFLVCPGCRNHSDSRSALRSSVDAKGLKGMTGTTSNCGDGSSGAHAEGWLCGQRVYKLFWVLARDSELRDAQLAEQWINGLSSGELARQSAAASRLIDRYGPVMGIDRMLRCRRCLKLRYGQSPEVLRKKRRQHATHRPKKHGNH